MKLYILLTIFLIILCTTLAMSTVYNVEIYDGIGAGSGDQHKTINNPIVNHTQTNQTKKLKNSATFQDDLEIKVNKFRTTQTDLIIIYEGVDTSDTAKEIINYTPYIIWGIIIMVLFVIVGGVWYIWQVYN